MSLILSIIIIIISIFGFISAPDTLYGITNSDNILLPFYFDPYFPFKYFGLTGISSFFFHGDLSHLLSNIFLFYFSAKYCEKMIGKFRLLLMLVLSQSFVLTWIVISHQGRDLTMSSYYLGASGVIFSLIYFDLIIYRKIGVAVLFTISLILEYLGYFSFFRVTNTAHQSHLSGVIIGIVLAFIYFVITKKRGSSHSLPT